MPWDTIKDIVMDCSESTTTKPKIKLVENTTDLL